MDRYQRLRRYGLFTAGVAVSAGGIAFITRAALGTSPLSSLPFVLSLITPPSVGVYTFAFNLLFLAAEAGPAPDLYPDAGIADSLYAAVLRLH